MEKRYLKLVVGMILLFSIVFGVGVLAGEDRISELEQELEADGFDWLVDYSGSDLYSSVDVYRENSDEVVARFENITNVNGSFEKYQIFLNGSFGEGLDENESLSVFDLRSLGGVEYDFVVDPTGTAITTCAELQNVSNDLAGDYYLANDIDCSESREWNLNGTSGFYEGFVPLGTVGSTFSGNFDGQNFKISGLYINRSAEDYIGLFGYVAGAGEIKDFYLEDVEIYGASIVGGVAGRANTKTFSGVYVSGNVSGTDTVGGVVGHLYQGVVSQSYFDGTLDASGGTVAGVVSKVQSATVNKSYSAGSLSSDGLYAGGVSAYIYTDGYLLNCYSQMNVSSSSTNVGGLAGRNTGFVNFSYSSGVVSGGSDTGGLIGFNSGTVENSFWDNETSGQTTSAAGVGKTTLEMKDVATYTSLATSGLDFPWDFYGDANDDSASEDIWDIDGGYPFFRYTDRDNYWVCGSENNWTNTACWSLGRLPVASDSVIINGSAGNINIWNNSMPQNLNSYVVEDSYTGEINYYPLFAVGNWTGRGDGTQEWDVMYNINISGGTHYIWGDYRLVDFFGVEGNITDEGHGQVWHSLGGNISVGEDATLDGVGLGFAADIPSVGWRRGGVHGGGVGGSLYGDASAPISLGGGGDSDGGGNPGGAGIKLFANELIEVSGEINMDGRETTNYGGGAGGSIWLKADTLSLMGSLGARGGTASSQGGGGRIRLEYGTSLISPGVISVDGIVAGTLTFTNNTWPGDWNLTGNIGLLGGDYGEGNVTNVLGNFNTNGYNLTIYGDCFYEVNNPSTCWNKTVDGRGVWINASGDINISEGSVLNGEGLGFPMDIGPGAGGWRQGGTYGGKGQASSKSPYGNQTHPISLGSGGDGADNGGGPGGAAIRLESPNEITIDGLLDMEGHEGLSYAGGSGGSIWIKSDNLAGRGVLIARGGRKNDDVRGGGGGRISLTGNTIGFSGIIDNKGGHGSVNGLGSGGTIYINATTITSLGNMSVVGYNGTTPGLEGTSGDWGQRITINGELLSLAGLYNASSLGAVGTVDGAINVNYTDCSSDFELATFDPDVTNLASETCSYGGTNVWNCSSAGNWSDVGCWSLGRVPVPGDDVVINGSGVGDCYAYNNTVAQNLNSFTVENDYSGDVYFLPLFAKGSWGDWQGTQEWNVTNNIIVNGTGSVYIYGDAFNGTLTDGVMKNITEEGHGQVWHSLSGNISVGEDATLDGVGLGFAKGVGPGYSGATRIGAYHGSYGGNWKSDFYYDWDLTYGNYSYPKALGSGSTFDSGGGFRGGSAIHLKSSTLAGIYGAINMSGYGEGASTGHYNTGASGGSVLVEATEVVGSGSLISRGGDGGDWGPGAGSGGRVAILGGMDEFSGIIDLAGGVASDDGFAGTFYTNQFGENFNLTVRGEFALPGGNYSLDTLNITSGAILGCQADNASLESGAQGVRINLNNLYVSEGGIISADSLGYEEFKGPGANTNDYACHAGLGDGESDLGRIYGSQTEPLDIGSGGQFPGGGAILVNASNQIIIGGNVTVRGLDLNMGYEQAGAGGSIYLISDFMNISGFLDARGGENTAYDNYGGAGRIALYANDMYLSGDVSSNGKFSDGTDSTGGTIYINSTSLTSSGEVSATGSRGETAKINISSSTMTLSGVYNATSNPGISGSGVNGTIGVTYLNCGSYLLDAIFSPSYSLVNCASCPPSIEIYSPDNESVHYSSSIVFNLSASSNVSSIDGCDFSLDGAENVSMDKINSSFFSYSYEGLTQGYNNITFYCMDANSAVGSEDVLNFEVSYLPDLFFGEVTHDFEIYSNESVFDVNISNDGTGNSTGVNLSCFVDGVLFDSKNISLVEAGSYSLTNCSGVVDSGFNRDFEFSIDILDEILEDNETNNNYSFIENVTQLSSIDVYDLEDDSENVFAWFAEEQETLPDEQTYFFANYTMDNSSASVEGAGCNISFEGGLEDGSIYEMSYNDSYEGGLYYYSREFENAGNYSWSVDCVKSGFESLSASEDVSVRIPFLNESSLSNSTGKIYVNWNDDVNFSVNVSEEDVDALSEGYNLSDVWVGITKPSGEQENVSLSGLASGGVWSGSWLASEHLGGLGNYVVEYFANLTNSYDVVEFKQSNFTIQNTSILINTESVVNTTDTINVEGYIRRTNGTDFWDIGNKLFLIKLNDVLVSSDSLNHTDFVSGSGENVNVSDRISLNLSEESSLEDYGDNFTTDSYRYDSNVVEYNSVGFSELNGQVFDAGQMTEDVGNLTYHFSSVTEFYDAGFYVTTSGDYIVGGGNNSVYYSFDNETWEYLTSSTASDELFGSTIPVDGQSEVYVRLVNDKSSGDNPVTSVKFNWTNYDYGLGSYVSEAINLQDVAYTVLKWGESGTGEIKLQLREGSNGVDWGDWSENYTNNLDNDITSFTEDYLQYRVWMEPTNNSLTPYFDNVVVYYFNATTNSTGGYSYNVTIPSDSLGVLPLEVELAENTETGIIGSNTTNLNVWSRTSVPYQVVKDYDNGETNYSVVVNFTRADTSELVDGTIEIVIYNSTDSWEEQCVGVNSCTLSKLVPSDLSRGNYSVNISAYNESAYLINASDSFDDYLEEVNTTGDLFVERKIITNYNPMESYEFYWNATVNNTGNAAMRSVHVYDYATGRGSGIESVTEMEACGTIWPGEVCNASMLIVVAQGSSSGNHSISWQASWENNDGSIAEGAPGYLSFISNTVEIVGNSILNISNFSVSKTIQHDNSDSFDFNILSEGTDSITNIEVGVVEENLSVSDEPISASWVEFSDSSIPGLAGGQTETISVNISVPVQTSPGNYSGIINVSSSNGGYAEMNLSVEVPQNGSWYLEPAINSSYNRSFSLNTEGEIGNFTLVNLGNVNLSFDVSYDNWGETNYKLISDLFVEDDSETVPGLVVNPTQVNVTKGENSTITLYQTGGQGTYDEVGIEMTLANSSATPSSFVIRDEFWVYEQPPEVTSVWFILDGVYGEKAELDKNLTIKTRVDDDVKVNLSSVSYNVTWNSGSDSESVNASDLCGLFGECDEEGGTNKRYANFSANFTPTETGDYEVYVTAYDGSGQSVTSYAYNFTTYGTTSVGLEQNISSFNITKVDASNSESFYVNYSINNTGEVYAYSPELSFSSNENISVDSYNFDDLVFGGVDSILREVAVSALTPPGTYSLEGSLSWTNPDGTISLDSVSLDVEVSSNRSFSKTESFSFTVPSGSSDSDVLVINNTGNDVLSSFSYECVSGSLCDSLSVELNESGFDLNANESKSLNLSVSAASGLTGGSYSGTMSVSFGELSELVSLGASVPETLTWNATPQNMTYIRGASQSGNLEEVVIENTGNINISFDLASTNSSIVGTNVSSIVVPKLTNRSFMVNFSAPSVEGEYLENITISNSSATPEEIVVEISLTSTEMSVTIVSPTNETPVENVTAGDVLEINATAIYGVEEIDSNSSWSVDVNSVECENVSYSYSGSSWEVSCLAPSLEDGVAHDLMLTLIHDSYGTVYETEEDAVVYRDVTSPQFVTERNHVALGDNINLRVNVSDNVALSEVWGFLTYPNSSEKNLTFSLDGAYYVNNTISLGDAGEYLVNYSANDTTGNLNSTLDWFEVQDNYTWSEEIVDYESLGVEGVNVSLFRPNTTTRLLSNVTNSGGDFSFIVNKRFYDFRLDFSGDYVIIENVNFTNATLNNLSIDFHRMLGENLEEIIPLNKPFVGLAFNSTGVDSNSVRVAFNYSDYNYDVPGELSVVKCADWNYSSRACDGSWSSLETSRNVDSNMIEGNSSGFSAYFLTENKCGNGACEASYGETTSTCSDDCKETSVTVTTTGGGGGGGGGLSTGDFERIEEIIKSFVDIGGLKVETTSIYKELFAGDTTTVRIKIRNTLNEENVFELGKSGDISQFIFFESTKISLNPAEARDILIKIVAPKFIDTGDYNGDLIIKSGEEEGEVPVTIKILSPEGKLMDVKIQPLTPTVRPGGVLKLQTDLLNLGKTKRIDVQFDLQLMDIDTGETLARQEEAFAVETSSSVIKNMTIPEEIDTGKYMIKATAYYSNKEVDGTMQASSIAYINVQYPFLVRKLFGIPVWIYLIALLVIGAVIGAFFYIRWLEYQKKRFKVQVDVSKLPQASAHSGFVGKIAESGVRAFIDMNKLQTHTLVAGSTGSGKTVAAQDIVEEALKKNKSVIVFDPTAQWTGFLRKCEDKTMFKRYKYFDMKEKEARGFNGSIKTVRDPYELLNIKEYMNRPGEITVINVSHLTPKQIDIVVASSIEQIFNSEPEEKKELDTLLVYDEVHRLLPKFGGSGQGFVQLERGAREFRKWGMGILLISQVLSDFVGEIKANIGTEIQMGTRYEGDLERVSMKYGDDVLKSVVKEPVGTGMTVNAEYNSGKPYFIAFRPLLHSTRRLTNDELAKYEKYFDMIEDYEYQVSELKKLKVDVIDLELEMKMLKQKAKEGSFQMADMYLESLKPRIEEMWGKKGMQPKHLVKKRISKEEVMKGISKAKSERKKIQKEAPKGESVNQDILTLKSKIEEAKKKGKNTANIENKLKTLEEKVKPFKGKIPSNEAANLKKEVDAIKKEVGSL